LDFVHLTVFSQKHDVSETRSVSVFRSNESGSYSVGSWTSSKRRVHTGSIPVQWLGLALSKGPKRVEETFILPEDRNRSSFRNVFLRKHWEMDKVQKPDSSKFIKRPITRTEYLQLRADNAT
jgi:hypothetical protein